MFSIWILEDQSGAWQARFIASSQRFFFRRFGAGQMKRRVPGCACVAQWRPIKRSGNFGKYLINRYIPRVWRNLLDFLAVKRNADQLGSSPAPPMFQEGETPVEVTAAHADPMTLRIECNDRRDHKVAVFSGDTISRFGFPNAQIVPPQNGVRSDLPKHHRAASCRYRRKNALFCAPCALDDRGRVDLAVDGQVANKCLARDELVRANDALTNY